MRLPGVALAAVESAFNRLIADSTVPPALRGRCVCVALTGADMRLCFRFTAAHVILSDQPQAKADATIKGGAGALMAAALSGRAGGQTQTRDIELSGDLQTAREFESLLKSIDPDWEECLARHTGDIAAFQIGEAARGLRRWGQQAARAFTEDLRDYLQLEARLLPTAAEVERFNRAVDDLRAATERLEARARRLGSVASKRKDKGKHAKR